MTGRKNRALQVPLFVSYKALENFLKALYGTTEGTCSAQFFRPVMALNINVKRYIYVHEDIEGELLNLSIAMNGIPR